MNQQMTPPGGQPEKKGMSKGCLVGLIVGLVLLVLVVGAGLVCWYKKDALLKAGTVTMVNSITAELANNPVEGVDTVLVNQVAAAFIAKTEESEVDLQQFGQFAQNIQRLMNDKVIDADEADQFIDMMVEYYPELGDLLPPEGEPVEDTTVIIDSLEQVE